MSSLVSIAKDILDLAAENEWLRAQLAEAEKYKKLYWDEVEASRKHGEAMIVGMLDLCLIPGVMESVKENAP